MISNIFQIQTSLHKYLIISDFLFDFPYFALLICSILICSIINLRSRQKKNMIIWVKTALLILLWKEISSSVNSLRNRNIKAYCISVILSIFGIYDIFIIFFGSFLNVKGLFFIQIVASNPSVLSSKAEFKMFFCKW